jgi:hypothetical protein
MVLDLFSLAAIPTVAGAAEAVHQQRVLDGDAESEERQAPFYLDVFCDVPSRKRDEVHDSIVVLIDGKLRLRPKDPKTRLPKRAPEDSVEPHPFTGFYLPFPDEDLPDRPMPAAPVLGLVSTIPEDSSAAKSKYRKPKLNWVYADKDTRELKYGPRVEAREHVVGPWDWTEDEQGMTLDGEENLVAVEEEKGGFGWVVYWDRDDDRLKELDVGQKKRVLRCSLERRVVDEEGGTNFD